MKHKVIFLMGVSGSGKSTVGKLLSSSLGIPFFDGDEYHPKVNIDKMTVGIPLDDTDREPWLLRLNDLAKENLKNTTCIIACSALKKSYRTLLEKDIEDRVRWIHLEGSFDQIMSRLKYREDHFMPKALLQSQFETLEYPDEALIIDIKSEPKFIVNLIEEELKPTLSRISSK